jgi:hypothetical protein
MKKFEKKLATEDTEFFTFSLCSLCSLWLKNTKGGIK